MTLDADVVRARCGEIEQALDRLRRIRTTGRSARLQQMARFRNLLVHVYWNVDYGRVFDVLETDLEDLRAFSRRLGFSRGVGVLSGGAHQ